MSHGFKIGSAGLLVLLLIVVFMMSRDADDPDHQAEKAPSTGNGGISANKTDGTATADDSDPGSPATSSDLAIYVIPDPIGGIMFTYPGFTIADHARPLDDTELMTVRQQDGTFLDQGVYHLIKIRNPGPMRLHWTGYADGNAQILLSYWNNERFIQRDIRDGRENRTYAIDIQRPDREEYVYALINCTGGKIYTDAVHIESSDGGDFTKTDI